MASTSSSSLAEGEHTHTHSQVNVVGDGPASPFSERMQVLHHATGSTPTALEPRNNLYSFVSWLLGYLRYICGVLGYLAAGLPSVRVDQRHAESDTTNYSEKLESALQILNNSAVAESELYLEAKHKVFLSHSGARKDFVEQLCVDLE